MLLLQDVFPTPHAPDEIVKACPFTLLPIVEQLPSPPTHHALLFFCVYLCFSPQYLSKLQLNMNSAVLSWFPSQRKCQEWVARKTRCIILVLW